MPNGRITYDVGFNIEKSSIAKIQQILSDFQVLRVNDIKGSNTTDVNKLSKDLKQAQQAAAQLQSILAKSTNTRLNTVNIEKFSSELKKSNLSLESVYQTLSKTGVQGVNTFRALSAELLSTNKQLTKTDNAFSKLIGNFGKSLQYTVFAGISNTLINTLTGAVSYAKELDTSLNNIRIVTGKSADEMTRFAKAANQAAYEIGVTTTAYTDAALIYFQQGLGEKAANELARVTSEIANVTQQSTQAVSEEVTALINGYQLTANEAETAFDKLAAVAASTASNLAEISGAISKVASTANMVGVTIDSLTAQIATIISVTRQAPESVGTALRTIYARMMDLKNGADEDGVSLGDVSTKLHQMGVEVLDTSGELREMDAVINDVAQAWQTWSKAEQMAAAQAMGGKRQYNNLVALFDNWDKYTQSLQTAYDSAGTLQKQQDIYMESAEAHLKQLQAASEELKNSLLDADTVKGVTSALTSIVKGLSQITSTLGGGLPLLGSILGIVLQFKSITGPLAANLYKVAEGFANIGRNKKTLEQQRNIAQQLLEINQKNADYIAKDAIEAVQTAPYQEILSYKEQILNLDHVLTEEERARADAIMKESIQTQNELDLLDARNQKALEYARNLGYAEDEIGLIQQALRSLKTPLVDGSADTWNKISSNITSLHEDFEMVDAQIKKINSSTIRANKDFDKTSEEIEKIKEVLSTISSDDSLRKSFDPNLLQQYEAGLKQIQAELEDQSADNQYFSDESIRLANNIKNQLSKNIQSLKEQSDALYEDLLDDERLLYDETVNRGEILRTQRAGMLKDVNTKASITGFMKLTGAISNAVFAFNTWTNVVDSWDESSLTDKVSGVAIAFTQTATTIGGLIKAWPELMAVFANPIGLGLGIAAAVGAAAGVAATKISIGAKQIEKSLAKVREEADKNAATMKELTATYRELYDVNSEGENLIDEFNRLSKGVNSYGDNVSLTTEEYNRYKEIVNQLIAINPDLVEGYNAQGEAIINVKTAIDDTTEAMRKQRQEAMILSGDLIKQFHKIEEGYKQQLGQNSAFWKSITTLASSFISPLAGLAMGLFGDGLADKLSDTFSDNTRAFRDFYRDWLKENDLEASDENEARAKAEYQKKVKDLEQEVKANNRRIVESDLFKDDEFADKILTSPFANAYQKALDNMINIVDSSQNTAEYQQKIKKQMQELFNIEKVLDFDNNEEFQQVINKVGKTQKEWVEGVLQYLQKNNMTSDTHISFFRDFLGINIERDEFDSSNLKLVEESVDNIRKKFKAMAEDRGFDDKSISSIEGMITNLFKIGEITESTLDEVFSNEHISSGRELVHQFNDLYDTLQYRAAELQAEEDFTNIDKALTLLAKTTKLTKEEQKELNASLGDLAERYPELSNALKYATEDTERYKDILQSIREEIEKERIDASQRKANHAVVEIGLQVNEKDYDYAMQKISEFADAEYELDIKVKLDSDNDWQDTITKIRDIEEAAQVIGEDFVVASDKLRGLNNAFPGILEGIQYLADGTAKLNKEAVDTAIKQAQLEAQIDAEKTAEKLKHTQQELLAKAKEAQSMANIATQMAKKEVITDKEGKDAIAKMQKTAENFKRKTSKETAENEIDNLDALIDATDENYRQGAENASAMWKSATINAQAYANQAMDAIAAVSASLASGKKVPLKLDYSQLTSQYEGSGGSTSAKAATVATAVEEASFDVTDSAAWHQMAEQWQAIADEYTTAANDITGQLAELASGATSLNKTRENIKAGLGAKGSSKTANHSTIDYLHDEIDIYTKINREIEHYNDLLTLLQRQEKKLVGHGLEDNYTQQIKVLQQLENAQKRKLALAKQDLQIQRANLQTLGVTIEADGQIANYADILLNKQKAINALIAQYNAMTGVQQQNEGKLLKDRIEAEKTEYNNLKNQMEAYNKVYDSLNDITNEIDDIVDKQLELQIKRFNVMIDVHLDLAAAEKEWNAFRKKCQLRLGDNNFLGDAKAELHNFYILFQQGGDGIVNQVKDHVSQIMNEINVMKNGGYSSIYGDNMKQALEDLKKYNGELMDYLELYEDTLKQVWDDYLSQIDKTSQAFDTRIKQYEHIQKLIDHDINLINKIFTGPDMEKALIGQYTLSYHNALEQISAAREEKEYYEHLLQEALRQRDKYEFGTTEWQSANEAYEKYRDLWESATDALNDSLEKSIDAAAERFAQAMKNAWNNLDRQLFNGWDLATVSDDWTRGKQRSEMFLDDSAERDLNMQKLRADWNKLLNNYKAGSKAQKELSEYMDKQVEALENQRILTKEDIELARLRIQLKEQEIALEDAQDNKTKLRLRRDSQGNYTYQYTADENNILEQEAQVSATRLELYEKEREAQQQALDRMLEARQAYSEAIQAIMDDDALTDEQKQQKIAEVTEYYTQLMTDIAENYSDLQKGFKQDLATFFADVDQTQIYPEFETTLGDMMNRFAYDPDSLQNVIMEAYEEISRANEEYAQAVEEACDRAGVNIEDLIDIKNNDIITTRDQIIAEQDLIAKYIDEEQQLRYVINELDNMRSAYEAVRAGALEVADAAHRMFEEISLAANGWRDYANAARQAQAIAAYSPTPIEAPTTTAPRTAPLNLQSNFGVNPDNTKHPERNDAQNRNYRVYTVSEGGKQTQEWNDLTREEAEKKRDELNERSNGHYTAYMSHYDTGGYTGAWVNGDSVGKLAVLHQKELVLDKTDTENVLAAVDIAKIAINAITSHLGQFNTGAMNSISNSNTEQQITINADFPNVSSATEIQEAFKQMANLAEQRAHRTRN